MEIDCLKAIGIAGVVLQTIAGFLFLLEHTMSHQGKSLDDLITNIRIWGAIQLTSRFKVRLLQLFFIAVIIIFLFLLIQGTAVSTSEEHTSFLLFILVESNLLDVKDYIFSVFGHDYNHYLYITAFYLILQTSLMPMIMRKRRIFIQITTDKSALYIVCMNLLTFLLSVFPLITLIILTQIPRLTSNYYFIYPAALFIFILGGISILSLFVSFMLLIIRFFISLKPKIFWPFLLAIWLIGVIFLIINVCLS